MATSGTYYIDTADFATATAVWTNTTLTTKAADGYYSFGGSYRRQFNGLLQPIESCAVTPTGYKITKFVSNNTIQQVDCGGSTYYDYTESVTIRLTEPDGITPKVNNTGADVVINMLVDYSGCFGDTNQYPSEVIIANGESETYIYNTGVTNNCSGVECTVVTDIYNCYTSITPDSIVPTESFFPICPIPACTSYTVSTTSGTGQSYTYTACDGTASGGTIGGAGGYDADTFCAQTDTVELTGSELTLTTNSSCTE